MTDTAPALAPAPNDAKDAVEIAKTIIQALLIALVLRIVIFQPYTIPSSSMEPNLQTGDYIIVSKYSYGWSRYSIPLGLPLFRGRFLSRPPARGDIIVFRTPHEGHETLIKRLIGLPGDRVQVTGGVVYVNGKPVPQKLISQTQDHDNPLRPVSKVKETLPNGKRYVTYGGAPDGEADNTGVYIVPAEHYFFMGDNRDNSLDSRWPKAVGVGYVPAENLIGRAEIVVLSWRPGASIFKPWTWIMNLQSNRFFHQLS